MAYIPIDIDQAIQKECSRRRYSKQTLKTYLFCIHRFLDWTQKDLGKISKKDVRLFLEDLSDKNLAGNTMNTYHMAIRFLFEEVLDKRIWINIKYSKVPERVPVALTREEITRLFNSIENPKHRLMIEFLYSTGLRVSELINLKVSDLDFNNNCGWVRHGKGNKDRLFIISEKLKPLLSELVYGLNLEDYLFNSIRDKNYNARSLQQILKIAKSRAKIEKRITPHILRHSFATHLIENGYAVTEVQALLGHKSPETTFIYLHAASPQLIKIKSPLDDF